MPNAAGQETVVCAPSQLLAAACRRIAAAHAARGPDLTRLTVLLPQAHARSSFAQALRSAVGRAVVLLPRVTTLRGWAAEVVLDRPVTAATAREALLYQALAQRRWLAHADLWTVAAELSGLFDELTRWHVGLPATAEDFARRLDQAYRARAGASFVFEARLVHELWHALTRDVSRLDREAAYQIALASLARQATDPVYAIGLTQLAPSESSFLDRCAERVPVVRFVADSAHEDGSTAQERTLASAWPAVLTENLVTRAARLRAFSAVSPLSGRVRFFGARGAEQEAQAIDVSVRRWLLAGCKSIAVVVFDRVTARRARALLERAQVLVRDEAGWAFSTTSAATVIGRWFDAAGNDFYHRDLLDLFKSPFAFHDWPRPAWQQTVWRLERAMRAANVRAGIDRYIAFAENNADVALRQVLRRVERGAQALALRRRKTIAGWLAALQESLHEIGVQGGLEADAAGVQLLELLQALAAELSLDTLLIGFGEFRRWIARQLEAATFRDTSIDSPVVFTSLEATRLRAFDAVLLAGADATHLPRADTSTLFFNQNVRRELGLPGSAERIRELEALLFELIAGSTEVLVTWQHSRGDEVNLLSPLLERLRALHVLAWGDSLDERALAGLLVQAEVRCEDFVVPLAPTSAPSPISPPERVPAVISASAYNALMACPYQFFARYVLGLRELDEVQEDVDKADYGTRVHDILAQFHRAHRHVSDLTPEAAQHALETLSGAVFEKVIAADYLASAWLARWKAMIPRYLEWQREREAAGWTFRAAEDDRRLEIATPAGNKLTLRGRIDRVDLRDDGAVAVIDYKTQARQALKAKLQDVGEDVQLPVYALLWGGPVAAAAFLSMDRDDVLPVALEGDVGVLAVLVQERLTELFDAMLAGAPLPAQGVEAVCVHCEMNGLCRRKHWP